MSPTFSSAPPAQHARPDDRRNSVAIYGSPVSGSVSPKICNYIFGQLGLPKHHYGAAECNSLEEDGNGWSEALKREDCLGTCLTMPLKLQAFSRVDALTDEAQATGCINTTFFRPSPSSPSTLLHIGTNTDSPAVANVLLSSLLSAPSPFPPSAPHTFAPSAHAAALAIGSGGATRAAVHALRALGLKPIFVVNRDDAETDALLAHFGDEGGWGVRALRSVQDAERALRDLAEAGGRVVCGVGAVPCEEPKSEGERRVYDVAREVFSRRYEPEVREVEEGTLPLPEKPVFVDMAYKPLMTKLRVMAEEHGWKSVCGTEVVLVQQCLLWTGIEVPPAVRQGARDLLERE
ncbi:hypothetical protein JCM10449v2_000542 [Rhodotorula kratochvilovae]